MDKLPLDIEALPGKTDDQVVLSLKGPVTLSTVFAFQEQIRGEKSPVVILDMSSVPYVDSAGLGAIIGAHVTCTNSGRKFALAAVPDRVHTMFTMARVDNILKVFPSVEDAQQKLA